MYYERNEEESEDYVESVGKRIRGLENKLDDIEKEIIKGYDVLERLKKDPEMSEQFIKGVKSTLDDFNKYFKNE